MPLDLIDPTVQPVGAGIPNSPLASMFGRAVTAYGNTFPSALDRARMNLEQAQTGQIQQQTAAGGALGDTVARAIAMQTPTTTQQPVTGANTGMGPVPPPELGVTKPVTTPGMSTGDAMRAVLPDLVHYTANAGDVGKANALGLLVSSYLKGTPTDIASQAPGTATTQDLAMMSAGHPYAATPGGVLTERALGTPEMRNRAMKIQQIMDTQGASKQQAEAIVDGVVEGGLDPTTRQPYIVNKLDLMRQGQGSDNTPPPATAAPVASGNNNPFNLRPVGSTTGFQTFNSPQAGIMAGMNDLAIKLSGQSKAMGGKPVTLRNIISTYSPPNENNTESLIKNASQRMGVDPDAPLDLRYLQPLSEAILAQEGAGGSTVKPAAVALSAKPEDLNVDTGSTYGAPGLATQAAGMISAVTDPNATNPAQVASGKIGNMKADYLGLLESTGRQSDQSRGYVTSALPPTGKPTDMEAAWEKLTTGAGTAQQQGVDALNKVLSMREDDQKIVSNRSQYAPALVQQAMSNIIKEDRFIQNYGSPDLQASYRKQYYGTNVAPATPLEKGNALTVPGHFKNIQEVVDAVRAGTITRAQGKSIAVTQFGDK